MSVSIAIFNPSQSLSGGAYAYGGAGQEYTVTFAGTWALGDTGTLTFTDALTGLQVEIGGGNVSGIIPTFCYTFNNKLHVLAGGTDYFSALGQPTVFNDTNAAGNGFETLSNWFSTTDALVAMAPFQGNALFAARRNVQIWYLDPNPALDAKQQVLNNVGTVSAQSVQAVGDMDVFMLADNGFRSIRVRVASNNALIEDVGTPIDLIMQPLLARLTDAQKAAACGDVEPGTNRYFCFVPDPMNPNGVGYIYVYSYFPKAQVEAWSTYDPSYQVPLAAPASTYPNPATLTYTGLVPGKRYVWTPGANETKLVCGTTTLAPKPGAANTTAFSSFIATATIAVVTGSAPAATYTGSLTVTTYFTPVKFTVYNGQMYCIDAGSNLYALGGSTNLVYDNCGPSGISPFHSMREPGTRKTFESIDAGFQGTWQIGFACDYVTGKFKPVYNNTVSTYQFGNIPIGMSGTHYAFSFEENSNGYALFSSVLVHIQRNNAKGQ